MITKLLIGLNIVGSAGALIYLIYSMRTTTDDNKSPRLVRFEWALVATLGLNFLDQVRSLLNFSLPINPSGLNHMMVWVSSLLFAHYLRSNFK